MAHTYPIRVTNFGIKGAVPHLAVKYQLPQRLMALIPEHSAKGADSLLAAMKDEISQFAKKYPSSNYGRMLHVPTLTRHSYNSFSIAVRTSRPGYGMSDFKSSVNVEWEPADNKARILAVAALLKSIELPTLNASLECYADSIGNVGTAIMESAADLILVWKNQTIESLQEKKKFTDRMQDTRRVEDRVSHLSDIVDLHNAMLDRELERLMLLGKKNAKAKAATDVQREKAIRDEMAALRDLSKYLVAAQTALHNIMSNPIMRV